MYKVLIVEDDPMVAMINEKYIKKDGDFEVVCKVNNGLKALEYLQDNKVDLILLDVYMPNMSGVELLRAIRELGIDADAIMVTAANDSNTLESTIRLGVVDYLVKPFAYDRFKLALDKFVMYRNTLNNSDILSQKKVDTVFRESTSNEPTDLPKGIQEETMNSLINFLNSNPSVSLTGEEIGNQIGLSGVTVRRYMNYLVSIGIAKGEMDYETGGRPCIKYSVM